MRLWCMVGYWVDTLDKTPPFLPYHWAWLGSPAAGWSPPSPLGTFGHHNPVGVQHFNRQPPVVMLFNKPDL